MNDAPREPNRRCTLEHEWGMYKRSMAGVLDDEIFEKDEKESVEWGGEGGGVGFMV